MSQRKIQISKLRSTFFTGNTLLAPTPDIYP